MVSAHACVAGAAAAGAAALAPQWAQGYVAPLFPADKMPNMSKSCSFQGADLLNVSASAQFMVDFQWQTNTFMGYYGNPVAYDESATDVHKMLYKYTAGLFLPSNVFDLGVLVGRVFNSPSCALRQYTYKSAAQTKWPSAPKWPVGAKAGFVNKAKHYLKVVMNFFKTLAKMPFSPARFVGKVMYRLSWVAEKADVVMGKIDSWCCVPKKPSEWARGLPKWKTKINAAANLLGMKAFASMSDSCIPPECCEPRGAWIVNVIAKGLSVTSSLFKLVANVIMPAIYGLLCMLHGLASFIGTAGTWGTAQKGRRMLGGSGGGDGDGDSGGGGGSSSSAYELFHGELDSLPEASRAFVGRWLLLSRPQLEAVSASELAAAAAHPARRDLRVHVERLVGDQIVTLLRPIRDAMVWLKQLMVDFTALLRPVFELVLAPMAKIVAVMIDGLAAVSDFFAPLEDVLDAVASALDSLSWLECPSWLGFLCDLDQLAMDFFESALKWVGLDLKALFDSLVDEALKALGLPTEEQLIALLPDTDDLVDMEAAVERFVQPLVDRVVNVTRVVRDSVTVDPVATLFSNDGTNDFTIKGVGAELRYATSRTSTVMLDCSGVGAGLVPQPLLVHRQSDSCGSDDMSDKVLAAVGATGPVLALNVDPFISPKCAAANPEMQDLPGLDSGIFALVRVVYTCATADLIKLLSPLPPDLPPLNSAPSAATAAVHVASCPAGKVIRVDNVPRSDGSTMPLCTRYFERECNGRQTCSTPADRGESGSETRGYECCLSGAARCAYPVAFTYICVDPSDVSLNEQDKVAVVVPQASAQGGLRLGIRCTSLGATIRIKSAWVGSGLVKSDFTAQIKEMCEGKSRVALSGIRPDNYEASCAAYGLPDGAAGKTVRVNFQCTCEQGFIPSVDLASGECVPCLAGQFRNSSMSRCQPCPAGTTHTDHGRWKTTVVDPGFTVTPWPDYAKKCYPCPVGSVTLSDGASECASCPLGSIPSRPLETGNSACTPCPANSVSLANATSCEACPAGSETRFSGDAVCVPVPYGEYSTLGSGGIPCDAGQYSAIVGASKCLQCPAGTYASSTGSSSCTSCPMGTYADAPGAVLCTPCNETLPVTATTGSNSSAQCRPLPSRAQIEAYIESAKDRNGNVSLSCEQVLMIGVTEPNATRRAATLNRRKGQVGDGICNRWLWNTVECAWDGGDCCPGSCRVQTFNDSDSGQGAVRRAPLAAGDAQLSRACARSTMQCFDPAWAGKPDPERAAACRSLVAAGRSGRERPRMPRLLDALRPPSQRRALVAAAGDPRRINNSICDDEYNMVEFNYDGGDCCWTTCVKRVQGGAESCAYFNCLDAKAAAVPDREKPSLHVPLTMRDVGFVAESDLPSLGAVSADDNDPCFDGAVTVQEQRAPADNLNVTCETKCFWLTRTWTARDRAGNEASTTTTVLVQAEPFPLLLVVGASAGGAVLLLAAAAAAYKLKRRRAHNSKSAGVDDALAAAT
jgi:hypothetical protein